MKLHYKGSYNSDPDTLPQREHLPGAVQFKEPEDIKKLGMIVNGVGLILMVLLAIPAIIRCAPYSGKSIGQFMVGAMLSLFIILPHELLHAICFKEDVYLYTKFSSGLVFVVGTETMSKGRYILMCLLPNIILGMIPYLIGMLYPHILFLTVLGVVGIVSGAGDYLNVYYAITQMPKHARTYLNGFHSYWYLP